MWLLILLVVFIVLSLLHERRGRVGTASLIKDPHHIETWIAHHKRIGLSKIYIYWDDQESEMPPEDSIVKVFRMTPEFLAQNNYHVEDHWDNPTKWNEKQRIAVEHAMSLGETDWILHIDADELLYPDGSIDGVFKEVPETADTCVINNYELAPDHENYKNCFVEGTKFRRGQHMVAYGNGKGGGRSGRARSFGPHRCESTAGGTEHTFPDERLKLLHYVSCNLEEYMKKYELYGKFTDDIWGWAEHHRKSRDVLTTCESKESCTRQARDMFLEQRPQKPNENVLEIKNIA